MSSQLLRNIRKEYNYLCKLILRHYTSELHHENDIEELKAKAIKLSRLMKEVGI